MKAHNIRVRAFFRQESLDEGRNILASILPKGAELREERLDAETEGGVFTEPLYVLSAVVSKKGDVDSLIKKIFSRLGEADKRELKGSIDSRVDDDCNLYLRFDKKALAEGKFLLYTRDSVQVRIKMACFPKKREAAAAAALGFLNAQ